MHQGNKMPELAILCSAYMVNVCLQQLLANLVTWAEPSFVGNR